MTGLITRLRHCVSNVPRSSRIKELSSGKIPAVKYNLNCLSSLKFHNMNLQHISVRFFKCDLDFKKMTANTFIVS